MNNGPRRADSAREDDLVSRLYRQVAEEQAGRYAGGYDLAAGLARYRSWLDEHAAVALPQTRPQEVPGVPARLRGRGRAPLRRWGSWLAPVAAAVAVAGVAIGLVAARNTSVARPTPTANSAAPATIPKYYLTFDQPWTDKTKAVGLVLGDTVTGRRLFRLAPPRGLSFAGITGAADDRTFVTDADREPYDATDAQTQPRTWYLVRVTGAGTHLSLTMTRLPIPVTPDGGYVEGIALSPDGTKLAVATRPSYADPKPRELLRVYSVATGRVLRSWSAAPGQRVIERLLPTVGPDANSSLSWVGNDALAYVDAGGSAVVASGDVMVLDLSSPDGSLLASSRLISLTYDRGGGQSAARPPFRCGLYFIAVAGDGKSFVCGGSGVSTANLPDASAGQLRVLWCPADKPAWNTAAFAAFSLATGEQAGFVAGYRTGCPNVASVPLWTSDTGSVVIGYLARAVGPPAFGAFSRGRFRPLPLPLQGGTWQEYGGLVNEDAW
jgi:hypothetical protein